MKVVWLGQQETILPWLNDLRHGIATHCEVVAYGNGPEFIPEYDVSKIVEKEHPDVIMLGNNQYAFVNLDKVSVPMALKCTDPWANIDRHLQFIKDNSISLVLMNYNCATPEYQRQFHGKVKWGRLPHTLNTKLFYNMGLERIFDVACVGEGDPDTYPLRSLVFNNVKNMTGVKTNLPTAHSLGFGEYVKTMNTTKIFAYGNVNRTVGLSRKLIFPMAKLYEIMGCKTLCMMDTPDEAEELHLIPMENFVSITSTDYKDKIQYFLDHEDEGKNIADNGYKTMLKYHTVEIRSRELYEMLEGISKK